MNALSHECTSLAAVTKHDAVQNFFKSKELLTNLSTIYVLRYFRQVRF